VSHVKKEMAAKALLLRSLQGTLKGIVARAEAWVSRKLIVEDSLQQARYLYSLEH